MKVPSGFAPPEPFPCPFEISWIGPCRQLDRSKCKHAPNRWPYKEPEHHDPAKPYPKCSCGCGKPALRDCESAGSFVCGAPLAQGHRHGGH